MPRPPRSTLFPYTTLFRSHRRVEIRDHEVHAKVAIAKIYPRSVGRSRRTTSRTPSTRRMAAAMRDRKSTRLNSSHLGISYAVFCLKKKKKKNSKHEVKKSK